MNPSIPTLPKPKEDPRWRVVVGCAYDFTYGMEPSRHARLIEEVIDMHWQFISEMDATEKDDIKEAYLYILNALKKLKQAHPEDADLDKYILNRAEEIRVQLTELGCASSLYNTNPAVITRLD